MAIWHTDPDLKGRFHPQFPSDLQVIVHEGSFRFTQSKPEVMWARIHAKFVTDNATSIRVYAATLLNQPHQLKTLKVSQEILLVGHKDYQYTIRVTEEYLRERAAYEITPCAKCGLPEVFDPIPKLIEHSFPGLKDDPTIPSDALAMMTSFCPMCGGIMMIRHKQITDDVIAKAKPAPDVEPQPTAQTRSDKSSQAPTGYSAAKAQEPVESDDLFKKLKKWFGKQ